MARKSKAATVETTESELVEKWSAVADATPGVNAVIIESKDSPLEDAAEVIQVQSELDITSKEPEVIQETPVITEDVPVALSQPEVELGFAARYKTPEYTITKQGGLTFFDLPTK